VDAGAAGKLPGTGHAGRWFPALCALIAITAAFVALAAPWVQPRLDTAARHWFGAGNIVSRLVAPEPTVAPAPSMVPQPLQALASADFAQRVEAILQSHQAIYEQRVRAMSESLDAMRDQLARAAVSESAAIDGLNRRADRLQSAAAAVEARARASNVLALAVGLRRDIDAGVAIVRDSSALQSIGGISTSCRSCVAAAWAFHRWGSDHAGPGRGILGGAGALGGPYLELVVQPRLDTGASRVRCQLAIGR
jgi:hypothetical protein